MRNVIRLGKHLEETYLLTPFCLSVVEFGSFSRGHYIWILFMSRPVERCCPMFMSTCPDLNIYFVLSLIKPMYIDSQSE
jgi:hypothetical protein